MAPTKTTSETLSPPESDEFEFAVFGGGYGESITCHVGEGRWLVIDSCRNPETREPAALWYLKQLGIDPSRAVVLIVASHWDDDHIDGLADVVRSATSAPVAISAAIRNRDTVAWVARQSEATGEKLSSGVAELRSILELARDRLKWTKACVALPADTLAISPSEDACSRALEDLIQRATSSSITIARRYKAPPKSNMASIACVTTGLGTSVLFGGDLLSDENPKDGWNAAAALDPHPGKSHAVKVPHHGGTSGHSPSMWSELLVDEALAVVAPWSGGGRFLPVTDDVARLKGLAKDVYLTSAPRMGRARQPAEVERLLRKLGVGEIKRSIGWGFVVCRRKTDEGGWRVSTHGEASKL